MVARKRSKDLPLISPHTLSKSMREKHYVRYTMVPRTIGELGVRGVALELAASCERDAEKAEARRHRHVAALLLNAAAVYRVAARRLGRVESEARGHIFGGGRTARQFVRP